MSSLTTLLIVDDNPVDQQIIRRLLDQDPRQRYIFYEAELATQALEIVATTPIDCILLDYNLPDSNGLEVLAALSPGESGLTRRPVVMLTGLGDQGVAVQALQAGAMDYLAKDRLDGPHLTRAISEAICHHELRAEQYHRQRYLEQHTAELEAQIATLQTRLDSERERAELHAALAAEQIRFAKVAATVPGAICTLRLSPDGALSMPYASAAFERVFGLRPADVAESIAALTARLAPEHARVLRATIMESARTLQPWNYEYPYQHPAGGRIWVEGHSMPIRDADGGVLWHGVMTDVSERKRAEQELRELNADLERRVAERTAALQVSQERLALATRSAGIGVWDWDNTTNALEWDERMYEIYGISPTAFDKTHESWLRILHPDDRAKAEQVSLRTQRGEQEYDTEFRICHPDGSVRVIKAYAVIQRGPDGTPLRITGINLDITERRETEAILRQANRDMARASRMKDEFLANMSHELRTPINAILGFSESLHEQIYGPLSERQHVAVGSIATGGRHLLALINDILDLAKVESGRLEIQIEPVDVYALCQSSLLFVREQALKKRLQIGIHFAEQDVRIAADPMRLKQMLVNLLSNAVKFTPEGGSVRLELIISREADLAQIIVRDTGIGIAPADLGRLFQPFSQVDSSLDRRHEGTGLGLALVRRLAELHGGSVAVESTPGQGSTFTIALPYRQAPPPAADDLSPAATAPRGPADGPAVATMRGRVLLADDNEANTSMLSDYLRTKGYEVAVAWNGLDVLERIDAIQPQLILMDIQMPELDGMETIRRLRGRPAYAQTPIIALTALAMPGDRERCLQAGANEYLTKPVSLRGLVETIQRFLGV